MVIVIDVAADPPALRVESPSDFGSFSARVMGAAGCPDVTAALRAALAGSGRADDDLEHVWLSAAALRSLAHAAGPVDSSWPDGLAAMIDYAATKGWVEGRRGDEGALVRAHLESGA